MPHSRYPMPDSVTKIIVYLKAGKFCSEKVGEVAFPFGIRYV